MMMLQYFAKGGGGARGGGGFRGSSSKPSSSSKSSSKPSADARPAPVKSKPGDTIKTSDGKSVKTSPIKPANNKYSSSKGIVGEDGYTPKFKSGFQAPVGSTVYYPQHSALDYLPWVYLFSQNSPQHDNVTVVQPDGKQYEQTPEPQGVDGLAVFNWIILVAIALAVIGGIVWGVNKMTNK